MAAFGVDAFEGELPAVDLFFMSHVIHDWDDANCLKLLRRCHDALPQNGAVLVQEYLLNADHSESLLGVLQNFGLLFGTTGHQRNAGEITELITEAGFVDGGCTDIDHEQSIVIGYKK